LPITLLGFIAPTVVAITALYAVTPRLELKIMVKTSVLPLKDCNAC
jgi:hypothetical protein